MKFPRSTSRSVSICVSLLIAYAQIISSLVVFSPRTAYASSASQSEISHAGKYSQDPSAVTFVNNSQNATFREDEVLVRFRASATEHEKNTVAMVHGAGRKKLKGESGVEKFKVWGQSAQTVALSLLQQPSVELAEPNFLIRSDQAEGPLPNDEQFSEQWALRNTGQNGGQFGSDIDATAGWQIQTGTQSTIVAVIDSGIDFSHSDLAGNQWTNPSPGPDSDLHGWDYVTDDGVIKDEQGHGTAIAGIIAAHGNNGTGISGVMWRAGLMSLRVLDNTGTGDIADAVEAIDYAVTHGAQVINISWGTSGKSVVLKEALERALRRGVVIVCSAGNGGQNVDTASYYPASFGLRDLITVAATDNRDQLASWSNWGSGNVTVAAPGTNILTTKMGGGYWSVTGTSASAPLVAGLAGLIKTAQPGLRPNQVAQTITKGARRVASLEGKVSSGGVANVANSLTGLHGGQNRPASLPTPGYGSGGTGPGGTFSTAPPPRTTQAPANNLPNLDERRTARAEQPQARQPIQSNLMCADCDPQSGGGGGSYYPTSDPNFSTARMRPANEVGTPGVDLGSRNFNWGIPLVSLPGRAGMDLNLGLSYNSLVWTKDGSYIKYNADLGSPAPGFRLGLPILQQRFVDSQTSANAYLMVTSSGARVKMRQVGTSAIYESIDGTYTQLDATNPSAPIVRTTDGTQMTFEPAAINGEFRCNQIKDRNGNLISATFNPTNGHLSTITDTVGRVITFVYDASSNLQAIRQTWAGVSHDWATFEYGQVYIAPAFGGGLLVNGPNNNYVTVLNRVNLHDGTYFSFAYNVAFGQVNRINHYAADGHLLEYTSYNVDSSAGQTDCPRFTERVDWAENWNNGTEAITTYSVASDNSWAQQTAPDGTTIRKEFFATSGWQTGLTTLSEIWHGGTKKKWTTISWTQDDTGLPYQKNPRVTETNVYDAENNRKRVTIDYGAYAQWSLPNMIREYAADGTTEIRHNYIDYNLSQAYLDRRIIGLVSARHLSDTLTWHTIIYYAYDAGGSQLVATPNTTIRHDAAYGTGFTARGNLTSVTRYDVYDINDANKRTVTQMGYDTNGSLLFTKDPLNHQTSASYADAFADGTNRNSYAYPTTVTDADGFSSIAQYNFDFGAVTRTQDPKGAVFTTLYDTAGRVDRITNQFNGAYTRYVYSAYGDIATFSTIQDAAGEAFSVTYFDGAGRLRSSGGDLPGSTGQYRGQFWLYDNMGRVSQQTNPAEMNGSWAPIGDDAAGWVWTYQTYDWQGRPLQTTNPDGTTRENTYGGCGCAGGEVTTVRDERGRRRKFTKDVLGRLKQVDELNWNQSLYATTSYSYNARDQITQTNQSGQLRTFGYDGHGRLASRTTPEQGTTTYSYYADDTVQTVTDARGSKTNLNYNNRHLVTHISHDTSQASGVTTTNQSAFSYDAAGNRTNMTTWYLGTVNYEYNTLSQMTSETRYFDNVGSFTLSYEYNLAGQLKKITNPWNAVVNYGYDKVGRPTSVGGANYASGTGYVNNIAYRAFGMKQMGYANTKTLSLQYDNRMRVTRWDIPSVLGWEYAYATPLIQENTGRVAFADNIYDPTLDRSYDYDYVGRLWASHTGGEGRGHAGYQGGSWPPPDGPYAENYSYDQLGNLTWRNGWGAVNAQYSYSPAFANNRMTVNPVTGAGMSYDYAGNLTNDGTQSYSYDATGQQTYASATGLTQYYDGDRLRTRKTESGVDTYYLRSTVLGGQVVAELNSGGAWTRGYVYLGGQMLALQGGAGGQVSWVHQDPVTKSQRVTNSSGSVVSTIDLDPWGGETGRSSNQAFQPKRFTTYERDANGGDDAMHRRYQVNWSRFAQPDPYDGSYSLGDPQSFNRYAYVRNDPVNFTDPSGLDWQGDLGDPPPLPGGPTASVDIPISFDDPFDDPFFRRNDWGGAFLPVPMIPFEPPIGPILPQDPGSETGKENSLGVDFQMVDIRCKHLRELLNREAKYGTQEAAIMSSNAYGFNRLFGLVNEKGAMTVNGKPLDQDWLVDLKAVAHGKGVKAAAGAYGVGKSIWWGVNKNPWGKPVSRPFSEQGERNAIILAGLSVGFSTIFNEAFMSDVCPGY